MLILQQYLDHLGPLLAGFRGEPSRPVAGAAGDSRQCRPGWLFVAIPGARDDGARYAADAVRAGAVAVAAPREIPELPAQVAFLRVHEPYPAAGRIAEMAAGFPAARLRLLGVTGTKGKTTTAYLLRDILRGAGRRTGMIGTVEYDVGDGHPVEADRTTPTPFALQQLLADMTAHGMQDAVIEVSSNALHQRRAGTARFAGAIFTNLGRDHLDYHLSMDAYFAAKQLLFTEYLAPGGIGVINVDNERGRDLAAGLGGWPACLPLGQTATAGVRLEVIESSVRGSRLRLDLAAAGLRAVPAQLELQSPLMGIYNIYNLAQAAVLALALGVPAEGVVQAARQFAGAPGRLEAITTNNQVVAFVDYAHTEDSLRNVLENLRGLKPKRLLALLGCGGDRDRSKRPCMGKAAGELADIVYVTSDNPRTEKPEAIIAEIVAGIPAGTRVVVIPDRREAIRRLVADAVSGDVLLLAGKGHESYQEQNGIKTPFDDRVEVRAAFRDRGML